MDSVTQDAPGNTGGGGMTSGQRASPAKEKGKQVAICAHHQDLNQGPPFPTTPYLPAAPHIAHALPRTRVNARHSPVALHFTATCPLPKPFGCTLRAWIC
jgi:hypothetical protein